MPEPPLSRREARLRAEQERRQAEADTPADGVTEVEVTADDATEVEVTADDATEVEVTAEAEPEAEELDTTGAPRISRRTLALTGGVLAVGLVGAAAAVTSALTRSPGAPTHAATPPAPTGTPLPVASELPVPDIRQATATALCDSDAVVAALNSGTDADVIAAFGGAEAFRAQVASGAAPCVNLTDPDRVWMVVNKRTPIAIEGFLPPLVVASGVRNLVGGELRADVDEALGALGTASIAEGAGGLGVISAARADWFQRTVYDRELAAGGRAAADANTARPGYSEHQTGLAVDVVACDGVCGSFEGFGATAQGQWVADNAWRFGFIVRYESGYTDITGYVPEPWHLRYIGPELAAAYHAGGFHTLEEFFGLPAAPDYGD